MRATPFTVSADIDLGERIAPYICDDHPDVKIVAGSVPERLDNRTGGGLAYDVTEDEFLLRLPNGSRYLVRGGSEILYQRGPEVSDRDVVLFLLGTAWGALYYQRDLLPLHASAVISGGKVYAFTGPSGAGKSTLSAALSDRGLDFFTDDILAVDPGQLGKNVICYAGQKDLKLWDNALQLTDAKQLGPVRDAEGFEKNFATPAKSTGQASGTLAALVVLGSEKHDKANPISVSALPGGQALTQLSVSIYRPMMAEQMWGRKRLYKTLASLISATKVYRFNRPFLSREFDAGLDFVGRWIVEDSQAKPAS